jgi:hypothetical protein
MEDNIRMDPREIGWGDVDGIHLAQVRVKWRTLVNTIKAGNFLTS